MPRAVLLLLGAAGLSVTACSVAPKTSCTSNGECAEKQICSDEGVCEDVGCTVSAECGINQYCNASYECAPGCGDDADCVAGQICNPSTKACEAYGCRDTQLDCNYGEFCDPTTRSCFAADQDLCGSCNPNNAGSCGNGACYVNEVLDRTCNARNGDRDCASGSYCGIFEVDTSFTCDDWIGFPDDSQCPNGWYCDTLDPGTAPVGNYCHRDSCYTAACFYECGSDSRTDEDCPRGFQCVGLGAGAGEVCVADCAYLESNGFLE